MAYSYEDLKGKKVVELREIAKEVPVQGYSQMNKDHLIEALCKELNIDMFEHHVAHVSGKTALKKRIQELKKRRDEILASNARGGYHDVLREIKHCKRTLRASAD